MRVIAGIHRSRILEEVDSINTRETKDRVKESIFNSISHYLHDALVLDLFCGSGSLGIEALSRGSKHVVFNDYGKGPFEVTKRNLTSLSLEKQSTLYQKNYIECLKDVNQAFDIILLDPPYHMDVIDQILKLVDEYHLLKEDGIIVYLSSKQQAIPNNHALKEVKSKNIGITKVTYMRWS